MRTEFGSIELAQARILARHGQRAAATDWQRLETAREFTALLEVARTTPLRSWVTGITARSTLHEIEAVLRRHGHAVVAEVADWMPQEWQAAVGWCGVWPDLPVLQHLARGGGVLPWMHEDAELHALCATPMPARAGAVAGTRYAPLAPTWAAPDTLGEAWQLEWLRRLPQPVRGFDDPLHRVAEALRAHWAAFAVAPVGQARLLRQGLRARLVLLLRRSSLNPALAFIHLALCALDLERLRGELLRRAAFSVTGVA